MRGSRSFPRVDFGPAPPNYVSGIGRGATGFTTRSDVGPVSSSVTSLPSVLGGSGRGRNLSLAKGRSVAASAHIQESLQQELDGLQEASKRLRDEREDLEADEVYADIDQRMQQRRSRRRRLEKDEAARGDEALFVEAKRELAKVSESEWMAIPEPGDLAKKNKRMNLRQETMTPVPDSVIRLQQKNAADPRMDVAIDPVEKGERFVGDLQAAVGGLTTVGRARDKVLGLSLDKVADSVSGQTAVDPKGYMTSLESIKVASITDVSDFKKARLLLNSVTSTNPKHGPGWIAAARLEEAAGRIAEAREVILKGCEAAKEAEDVWIEAARLHEPVKARTIMARAVKFVPHSIKIWMQAAELEPELEKKKAVLRKALELIQNSVALWKEAVSLEDPENAKILLRQAVKCVPHSTEIWLALAKLESHQNARVALNAARAAIPKDLSIWIAAAELEESNGNCDPIKTIIRKAVKSLSKQKVLIDRQQWLKEATTAEKAGYFATCEAIIETTIGIGVEEADRLSTWKTDASQLLENNSPASARFLYRNILTAFPNKEILWIEAVGLEKRHGESSSVESLLAEAVQNCPNSEKLWLISAKEKQQHGDLESVRLILEGAFQANPNSEEIWLAAVKLECDSGEVSRARTLLERARQRASTPRIWMKSAKLEWELGNWDRELEILHDAIKIFKEYPKLWMMLGQYYASIGNDLEKAMDIYKSGLEHCSKSADLWLCLAQAEESMNLIPKARASFESARRKIPRNPRLWLEAVKFEQRHDENDHSSARNLMSRALMEIPRSGILWAHAIDMEPRAKRKNLVKSALQNCGDDSYVCLAVARLLWSERKMRSVREWFERAISTNKDLGDVWIFYFKFIQESSSDARDLEMKKLINRCEEAEPKHGDIWVQITKAWGNSRLKIDEILHIGASHIVFKELDWKYEKP